MTPGHYTELFFLDEPTALAAGHRPCAECRREHFNAFRRALAGNTAPLPSAVEIDAQLHADRLNADGSKRLHRAKLDKLPDGVFVLLPALAKAPLLIWGDELLAWSAAGYTDRFPRPHARTVDVLTPELTVRALRGGYTPEAPRQDCEVISRQSKDVSVS